MEKYRKTLKTRTVITGVSLAFFLILMVSLIILSQYGLWWAPADYYGLFSFDSYSDFILGFQTGICFGVIIILAYVFVNCCMSLCSENKLKKSYIDEHDERNKLIYDKTGGNVINIQLIILAAATIIGGYINDYVFFSMLVALMLSTFIKMGFKIYYKNKYS